MPRFIVTKLAGKEVAGMDNPGAGKPIDLTEAQAQHPLRLKHIERPKPAGKPEKTSGQD